MAVVSVSAVSTRVNGEANGHRTYSSIWQVITNSVQDGASTARIATGLPSYGDYYGWGTGSGPSGYNSWDLGAWVQSAHTAVLKEEQVTRKVWHVTVTHTSQSRTSEDSWPDSPLDQPWEVGRDADEWTEEATITTDNLFIRNSALRPIGGKAVERFRTRGKWTLTKNFTSVPQSWTDEIEGSMNSSTITLVGISYPRWTLYMRRIALQRLYYGAGSPYVRATFYIDNNPDTFNMKLIDKGRNQYDGVGDVTNPESYMEILDNVTQNPQPDGSYFLDGQGGVLPGDGDPVILNAPDGFQIYEATDWAGIGFPAF